jgi:phytoene desaturase
MGGGVNMQKEKYDVVVIGAGAGGISAGAFLAQAGYKTLVVEQLPFVGGRGSSLKYKGYNISTGAGGWLLQLKEDIFDPLGAPFNVRIPKPNTAYYLDGKCHEMPEKGKLRAALSIAAGEKEADKIMKLFQMAMNWEEPSNKISLRDWLLQYTKNERVIDVFNANWQVREVGAGAIFKEIKTMRSMDYGYAVKGNRSMWEAVADVVRSNNGEVWTRARTNKILIEEGIVKGVVVTKNLVKKSEEQVQIDAQAVVSNIGPYGTIKLGGEDNFDKGHIKDVRETIKTFPWLAFQVASSAPLIESPAVGFVVSARIVNWILCPTLLCPELAPEGKHITYVGAWIPPNPPWEFSKYLDMGIEDLRDIAPKYDKYAEEILHSAFFIRQSWPMYRSYDGHSLTSQKTSVQNLYNVGDAVFAPGKAGQPGAAMSGRMVAEDIEQRIKPM